MAKKTTQKGPLVPLSEDPAMDRLEEILRAQKPERREALMDTLNREAAEEDLNLIRGGDTDGQKDV